MASRKKAFDDSRCRSIRLPLLSHNQGDAIASGWAGLASIGVAGERNAGRGVLVGVEGTIRLDPVPACVCWRLPAGVVAVDDCDDQWVIHQWPFNVKYRPCQA